MESANALTNKSIKMNVLVLINAKQLLKKLLTVFALERKFLLAMSVLTKQVKDLTYSYTEERNS